MTLIVPNDPPTLFDPEPWRAHVDELCRLRDDERDDTIRQIICSEIASAEETIRLIESGASISPPTR